MNNQEIKAQYELAKVEGRSYKCPRNGIYKVIEVHQGTCFNKPALMAMTHWKSNKAEAYSESIFEIQLESFKNSNSESKKENIDPANIIGREMIVNEASLASTGSLILAWEFLPSKITLLQELNTALKKSNYAFNMDDEDFLFID